MMTNKGLKLHNPGLMAFLQDGGRHGVRQLGITESGALDEYAFLWANRLLGNALTAPCIESVMGGMRLEAQVDTSMVVTGAVAPLQINGLAKTLWQTHHIAAGDIIDIGHCSKGLRTYIGVSGGFDLPLDWGSCAAVEREGIGGLKQDGKSLESGDIIPCRASPIPQHRFLNECFVPHYPGRLQIRLIPGYQYEQLSDQVKMRLMNAAYLVSADSDRTGLRLTTMGAPLLDTHNMPLLSVGVCFGALQIPADGHPIVMLKDRHTLGSYPIIGSILPVDCFRLSQLMLGSQVRINTISADEGLTLMRQFYQQFQDSGNFSSECVSDPEEQASAM